MCNNEISIQCRNKHTGIGTVFLTTVHKQVTGDKITILTNSVAYYVIETRNKNYSTPFILCSVNKMNSKWKLEWKIER